MRGVGEAVPGPSRTAARAAYFQGRADVEIAGAQRLATATLTRPGGVGGGGGSNPDRSV
jgi:hypothetical protein